MSNQRSGDLVYRYPGGRIHVAWLIVGTYFLAQGIMYLDSVMIEGLRLVLNATGDINPETGDLSPFAEWLDTAVIPLTTQILMEVSLVIASLLIWRCLLKRPVAEIGLTAFPKGGKEFLIGLAAGCICCTLVFAILMASGLVSLESWTPRFYPRQFWWLLAYIGVGFAEEIYFRGFCMAVLRPTKNKLLVISISSLIFSLVHMFNPNITFLALANIFLIGIVLAYMYFLSGNLWMAIGFHITWNTFQGLVYGSNVSGTESNGVFTMAFAEKGVFFSGGNAGMEGGIVTTFVSLLLFCFVLLYYRKTSYSFFSMKRWRERRIRSMKNHRDLDMRRLANIRHVTAIRYGSRSIEESVQA